MFAWMKIDKTLILRKVAGYYLGFCEAGIVYN